MIERYSRPEMTAVWSQENKYRQWLKVELLACEAWAKLGLVPMSALSNIKKKAAFEPSRVDEIEAVVKHDVIAFLTNVAEHVGDDARFIHVGLTSSDVLDTALAIQMKDAADIIIKDIKELLAALKERAFEHKDTVMIGRSHGIHAEPTTFGLKMALWYDEMKRNLARVEEARDAAAYGKISGAVGTFANVDPFVEEYVCRKAGLKPAPVSTQVVQRDCHAQYMAALALVASSLDKFSVEIRHLQRTEVYEAEEYFSKGQKGSSAMPHKRNPIGCEQITGLARLIRGNATAALENVALWHERDISHSSDEHVILPDSFIALDHMLRRITRIVSGMVDYPDRMKENHERSRGVVFSGTVLLELARRGVSREQAYEWVQRNAMRSFHERTDFRSLLLADRDLMQVLTPADVEKAFDLDDQLRNVDAIFDRVFSGVAAVQS